MILKGMPNYYKDTLSQCLCVYHKTHIDWRGIEFWPPVLKPWDGQPKVDRPDTFLSGLSMTE
jgi:hypothetical protein